MMSYLKKLGLIARWFLPPQDADEVVEDYAVLLANGKEPGGGMGTPMEAVRELRWGSSYYRWLAAFGCMILCLALPALSVVCERFALPVLLLSIPGVILAFKTLRRDGRAGNGRPGGLLPALGLLLAAAAAVAAVSLYFLLSAAPVNGRVLDGLLKAVVLVSLLAGVAGLVLARIADRRWRALFLLSLTAVLFLALLHQLLHTLSAAVSIYDPLLVGGLILAAAGLLLTRRGMC